MNSSSMASALAGWSIGTMWPASYTLRNVRGPLDFTVPPTRVSW